MIITPFEWVNFLIQCDVNSVLHHSYIAFAQCWNWKDLLVRNGDIMAWYIQARRCIPSGREFDLKENILGRLSPSNWRWNNWNIITVLAKGRCGVKCSHDVILLLSDIFNSALDCGLCRIEIAGWTCTFSKLCLNHVFSTLKVIGSCQ